MNYRIANDLKDALDLLRKNKGEARAVAGATDLFLQDFSGFLVDISEIPELTGVEEKDGLLQVGAALTHSDAALSDPIKKKATALAEACSRIGSPQVRNIGTLGGNVVNAAPAADAAVALVGLGAEAVLVDLEGRSRQKAVEELYLDYNCSLVESSSEIIARLLISPCRSGEGSAFSRFAPRKSLSLPLVNAAARVRLSDSGIAEARLVVAPVKPFPTRLKRTENLLPGCLLQEVPWAEIEKTAVEEVAVRGSLLRCSAQYRRHLVGVLAGRALKTALERACGNELGGEK
ncbi:MAG: FAD binding domain-containing protein [Bacillota bacterium]